MNDYKKIRELRNERLCDGEPPLKFGCEIVFEEVMWCIKNDEDIKLDDCLEFGYFSQMPIWKGDNKIITFYDKTRGWNHPVYEEIQQTIEILGKPVSLNDILRLLKKKRVQIQSNGVLQEVSGDTYETEKQVIHCNIDLTKEISEQEPETLSKLLAIIK